MDSAVFTVASPSSVSASSLYDYLNVYYALQLLSIVVFVPIRLGVLAPLPQPSHHLHAASDDIIMSSIRTLQSRESHIYVCFAFIAISKSIRSINVRTAVHEFIIYAHLAIAVVALVFDVRIGAIIA